MLCWCWIKFLRVVSSAVFDEKKYPLLSVLCHVPEAFFEAKNVTDFFQPELWSGTCWGVHKGSSIKNIPKYRPKFALSLPCPHWPIFSLSFLQTSAHLDSEDAEQVLGSIHPVFVAMWVCKMHAVYCLLFLPEPIGPANCYHVHVLTVCHPLASAMLVLCPK